MDPAKRCDLADIPPVSLQPWCMATAVRRHAGHVLVGIEVITRSAVATWLTEPVGETNPRHRTAIAVQGTVPGPTRWKGRPARPEWLLCVSFQSGKHPLPTALP